MTYQEFDQFIRSMSEDIVAECGTDIDKAHDLSFERANDCEYAIYYSKAWDLCDYFRFNHYEAYVEAEYIIEELGGLGNYNSVDALMCDIASCIVLDALREAIDTLMTQEGLVA